MTDPLNPRTPDGLVTIGDQTIRLRSFKAFKAAHALAIVATIADQASSISEEYSDFQRRYSETHTTRVPESIVAVRGWDVPDPLWKVDETGARYLELPERPSEEQAILHVFESAYRLARTEVLRLLALLTIGDSDLATAEDDGTVDDTLDREGKRLFRTAETWQIVDLLHAGIALLRDELLQRREKMGEIRGLRTSRTATAPTVQTPASPASETPTDGSTGPSTSSPEPTDGVAVRSSMEPATATS